MQSSSEKFKKHASAIEFDIFNLMFGLINTINDNMQILRYLMDLHLQVKTIASIEVKGDNNATIKPKLFDTPSQHLSDIYNEDDLLEKSEDDSTPTTKKSEETKSLSIHKEELAEKAKQFINELIDFAMIEAMGRSNENDTKNKPTIPNTSSRISRNSVNKQNQNTDDDNNKNNEGVRANSSKTQFKENDRMSITSSNLDLDEEIDNMFSNDFDALNKGCGDLFNESDDNSSNDEKEILPKKPKGKLQSEHCIFPEVLNTDVMPQTAKSTSVISEDHSKSIKPSIRKSLKQTKVSKIPLDPATYERICCAIQKSINKSELTKPKKRRNVARGKSELDVDQFVNSMLPCIQDDIQEFFLKRTQIVNPWNKKIMCGYANLK